MYPYYKRQTFKRAGQLSIVYRRGGISLLSLMYKGIVAFRMVVLNSDNQPSRDHNCE